MIGRKFSDPEVQKDILLWPFKVVKAENDKIAIQVTYKQQVKKFAPEEISAMILTKMKETAESLLGTKVFDAVITVPAYFNDAQRQSTKDAGRIAGLTVHRIINEPTAAALAYGLQNEKKGERNVLIFDLGGGTFDVSILTIDSGVFEVKATNGNTHLGGEDFDNRMVKYCIDEFEKKNKKSISENPRALRRLKATCERAKLTLSSQAQVSIQVDSIVNGIDLNINMSRAKFEQINSDLFNNCIAPVENVINDSKLEKSSIDEIVLVGGSTRIPRIQKIVQDIFNGKELIKSINPDEAIAYGATIQASILSGMKEKFVLLDVIPLSIGIETKGDIMSTLISRNTMTPCKNERNYTTVYDNQTSVSFKVYEGENPVASKNHFLGSFILDGIPPAPARSPQIIVTFDIDVDGIINASAKETQSGNKNNIIIRKEKGGLSKDQIDKMILEAKLLKKDDEELQRSLKAMNLLEEFISETQQKLNENNKLSNSNKETIISACEEVQSWLESNPSATADQYEKQKVNLVNKVQPLFTKAQRPSF